MPEKIRWLRRAFLFAVSFAVGCGAPASSPPPRSAGESAAPSGAARTPQSPEADVAYYRARAAELAKELPAEIQRTDFVRMRRGRLYFPDGLKRKDASDAQERLGTAFRNKDFPAVLDATQAILADDQADMRAHMLRSTALEEMKRTAEASFHREVALALVDSIMNSGDGQGTATAWKVFHVKEEYEIAKVLGCVVVGQRLKNADKRLFDVLDVRRVKDGREFQLFFEITELFVENGKRLEAEMK